MNKKITILSLMSLILFIVNLNLYKTYSFENYDYIDRGNLRFIWSNQEGVLNLKIGDETNETFNPNDRQWNGLPAITVTPGGRLWAVWMTGGNLEPDKYNYNVMYYSDDGGDTWSDEFLIIVSKIDDRNVYTPNLFFDNDGLMWYYINYGGTHGIIINNPDCENPSKELTFSSSLFSLTPNPLAHKPTILSDKNDNLWLAPLESTSHLLTQRIFHSTNKTLWEEYSELTTGSPSNKRFNESQIVELSDGSLMILSRLDGGTGIERAYSYDSGKTWTRFETNLNPPLIGPGSKFEIGKLNSGSILLINHNSTTKREKIVAYLSKDDGKTWPYSLVLDERDINGEYWGVSYPYFTEDENGVIYVVWDQRTPLIEINIARFTEDEIVNGKIKPPNFTYKNIVRNSQYTDIISIVETIPTLLNFKVGTKEEDILKDLPKSLTLTNTKNETMVVTGSFEIVDYNPNEVGTYKARFISNDIPNLWIDSYGYLNIKITIENNSNNILRNIILVTSISFGLISGLLLVLLKRRNIKK